MITGVFVNRLGGFLQAFLVLYLVQDGYDAGQAGIALGANGAGAIVGILLGSWLVDHIGARRAITGSMTSTAVLTAAVPAATSFPVLLVIVTVLGATSQIYRPVSAQLVSAGVPAQRQVMAFALYRMAQNLGTTAAPLLGALLAAVSYHVLFWGEAIAALMCAAICQRTLPADPPRAAQTSHHPSSRGGYLAVLRDLRYLAFLVGMLAYSAVYIQYVSVLPLAVHDAGWPTMVYGIMVALNGIMVITCELAVTRKVQHWPRRLGAACGVVLVAAGLAAYSLPLGVVCFALATVVWSLGEVVGSPTMVAYPVQAASAELTGRYLGASQAMFGVGTAVGPMVGVALWQGMQGAAWLVFAGIALVAAAAITAGMRGDRIRTPEAALSGMLTDGGDCDRAGTDEDSARAW
ncbi:MFS transporter [Streptomyces spectabilis]|uniref:MFS transporter n=1 Tax=Streptomyces spectabilis TaxID=68270 RepID=UPI001CEF9D15|nr:MFS transporter [Streptomyces spectabilis]